MRSISKLKIFLAFIVCLMAGNLVSQDIQLTIIAPPPHPSLLSEFQEFSDNYRVNITNQNAFQDYNIIIQGRLSSDNGIEAQFSENFNDYQIIEIPAGSSQVFLFEELGNFFDNISLDDIDYSGGPDVAYLIQSQRLPDGIYSICLEARDFDSRELLSLPLEANCSNPIIIQSVNPPVITNPMEEEVINQVQPTLINISWTPVIAPSSSIVYDLRLAEFSDLINPYDAIENENFLQFEEVDIRSNVFIYNQAHTLLIPGKKYIVQVKARDENNSVNIFNQGWSDIVVFTFGQDENPNDNEFEDGDFACMSPCVSIDIPDVPAIPSINIGDIFKLGHFNLQIDNFQQTVNGYSGNGVIKASDFIPKDINVSFQDVRINSNNIVTNGAVNGLRKASAEAFPRVNTFTQNSNIDEHFIDRLYDELLDPAAAMISEDINESIDEIAGALSLPISFGEGEYKIHIPDMTFTAEGATVSMLSGYELQGDYLSGSEKIVFASDNICITPGGISLTDDILKLDIVKPYDFDPSEVFGLHINGREGDNPSYIDFDCDGINEIILNGFLAFNNDYVSPLTDDFEQVNGKKLAVDYTANFTDWNEIIISANTINSGNRGPNFFSSNFEIKALPEFKFSFDNLVMDLSENENKPNMIFPSGYGSPANWTGIVVDELQMQLPDYFEHNNSAIDLGIEQFIIDDRGVSFNFRAQNMQELSDISIGGWGLSVSELRLDLLRNDIDLARLDGNIEMPICENPVGITGEIERVDNKLDYSFDLDIRENIEIPMWASEFKLNDQCRILAKIEDGTFKIKSLLSGELELDESIGSWDQVDIKGIRFEDMLVSNTAPYFETGDFDINAVVNATFAGFSINLKDISIEDIELPGVVGKMPELGFNIGFKFGDQSGGGGGYFSADSRISLRGKRNRNSGDYSLDRAHLQRIEVESGVPSVRIKGSLDLYDDHPVYGDGIGGSVKASFVNLGEINSKVLFGNIRDYDYWYVDAGVRFQTGIPLVAPIELLGFSGGAYYNMRQTIDRSAPIGEASVTYVPRRDGWGFRIGTVWATMGINSTLNGNAHLLVDFRNGFSLRSITLTGKAKMMDEPSFSSDDVANTELILNGIIQYNHEHTTLNADFGYQIDIPRNVGLLTGGNLNNRNISLLVAGLDNWHLHLGKPRPDGGLSDMLGVNLNLAYKLRDNNKRINNTGTGNGIYGYFNIGSNLPMSGGFPAAAQEVLGNTGVIHYSPQRSGVSMGLHAAFTTGNCQFGWRRLNLWFRASAGLGFDISYTKYYNTLCNGNPNFGINNWYFESSAYLYARAAAGGSILGWNFTLADVSLGTSVKFNGPNPIYSKGKFRLKIDIPIIPTFRVNVGFKIGTKCEFSEDLSVDVDYEDEFAGIEVVDELTNIPMEEVDILHINPHINASFFKRTGIIHQELYQNRVFQYKVVPSYKIEVMVDGVYVQKYNTHQMKAVELNNGDIRIFINKTKRGVRMLRPGKNYRLTVTGVVKLRQGNQGPFIVATFDDGERLETTKTVEFSSTSLDDYELEVTDMNPEPNLKNLHFGDLGFGVGSIDISNESRTLMNRLGYGDYATLNFRFLEYSRSNPLIQLREFTSEGFFSPVDDYKMLFNVAPLRTDRRYKMEVLLQYEDEEPKRMHWSYFETSDYKWYRAKIRALVPEEINVQSSGFSYDVFALTFRGQESFVAAEEELYMSYESQTTLGLTEWHQKRIAMEDFAEQHGFLNTIRVLTPEFVARNLDPIDKNSPPDNYNQNLNDIISGDPVLRYTWRPNQYVAALRQWAINNHFGVIYGNNELQNLFFNSYQPITHQGEIKVKLKSTSGAITERFDFQF